MSDSCERCRQHITRSNIVNGNNVLSLVNIPQSSLHMYTMSELLQIKAIAIDGSTQCRNCKMLCSQKNPFNPNCRAQHDVMFMTHKSLGNFRLQRDTATIQDINAEILRRERLRATAEAYAKINASRQKPGYITKI